MTVTAQRRSKIGIPRLVGQLWGTNNLGDDLAAFSYILRKNQLVQGPVIRKYEQAFAQKVGTRYAYSFSSGRVALYAILQGLSIQQGDDVLMQVPSHIVVANAIRYTGACPIYVDCQLENFNMDLQQAEERITPNTKVLLLQHTFGIPVDMDAAMDLARRKNLFLLEDCVHALGATYRGKMAGSFGKAGFFSTEETKIISSTMGGMAVTDDPELAARLEAYQASYPWPTADVTARYLWKVILYHLFTHPVLHRYTRPLYIYLKKNPRTHMAPGATGNDESYGARPAHFEMRLSNGQAAIALRQLNRLDENLAHRRAVAAEYAKGLAALGYRIPHVPEGAQPAYVRYPILVSNREGADRAAGSHVVFGHWFDSVLEESASPEYGDYVPGTCPRAEQAAKHLLNLPTHMRVSRQDINAIVASLEGWNW